MTCTNGSGITRTWGDLPTCLAREKLSCTLGLGAPATGSTPVTVENCVAVYPTYSCADFLDNNPPPACIPVGPAANGAPCGFAAQCASDFCDNNKNSQCGTCAALPTTGAACMDSGCGRNQECVPSTFMCQTLGAVGATCEPFTNPCAADLSCSGPTTGKTCMTPVAVLGMPCGGTLPGCDGTMGLVCGGAAGAKTCVAIPYGANGAACGTLPDGTFAGCANGACYTATGVATSGQMGMCKTDALEGAACDIMLGPGCQTPARCIVAGTATTGTCTLPSDTSCH